MLFAWLEGWTRAMYTICLGFAFHQTFLLVGLASVHGSRRFGVIDTRLLKVVDGISQSAEIAR